MTASEALNEIIQNIQSSNLNFNVNHTPFSAYITIRSSFNKNYAPPPPVPVSIDHLNARNYDSEKVKELEQENLILCLQVKSLEKENCLIRTEFENLSKSIKTHDSANLKAKSEVSTIQEEKRMLQIKHEKVCAEIRSLKSEKEDLLLELKNYSVADKSKTKEIFELKRCIEKFENQLKDLRDFKEQKLAEDLAVKLQKKKQNKKARQELQKEAKLKVAEMKAIRSPTEFLDLNLNEQPKEGSGDCHKKVSRENSVAHAGDLKNKPKSTQVISNKEELSEQIEQNRQAFQKNSDDEDVSDNLATFRKATKEAFDDVRKQLNLDV